MGDKVINILIDRFLKDVDEVGSMPWQQPYKRYNSINYVSMKPYRGINRLLLPFGEYLTANQINTINKEKGEDYKFKKGIKWYPVSYYSTNEKPATEQEISVLASKGFDINEYGYIGQDSYWVYYNTETGYTKRKSVLRYYMVADRHDFVNSRGEIPPSRFELGDVELTLSKPKEVIDKYVATSKVKVSYNHNGSPYYSPQSDKVYLNPHHVSEEEYFSTAFHEFAHSTGAESRLCRKSIVTNSKELYATEECIAEIAAYLCCSECGISSFVTSGTKQYSNSAAYVHYWKERVRDFGGKLLSICSQADQAFNYIFREEI